MINNLDEKNVPKQIIETIKKGEIIPYKLVNSFLTLENGDTQNHSRLNPYGDLAMQLKDCANSGLMSKNLCFKTIGCEEEIYQKLLRILKEYSKELISDTSTPDEVDRLATNIFTNYFTVVYGRDNIPMDKDGNLSPEYQKSITKLVERKKQFEKRPTLDFGEI